MPHEKDKQFNTTQKMLEWQYYQILGDLQEIQRHNGDETCPCRLSEELGENCLAKHSLGLSIIAAETAAMETNKDNAKLLWALAGDAKEHHQQIKGFLCHKEDAPEFGDWSRQWRKKFEPIYYRTCAVEVKDSGELEDAATDKIESQTFGIKMAATELSSACPEHAGEKSFTGIVKELNKRADAIDKIVEDLMSRPNVEPVRATTRPVSSAATKISGPIDNTFAFGITTSQRYIFQWKIVDAKDLIVSHDPFTFALNPKFTARLQPRKRERAAYQLQVQNIAGTLNPDQLIVDTHTIDTGSPIIGDKDNLVECGNGRVIALLIAAKEYPERIAAYNKRLKEIAPSYGLPTAGIDKMAIPVLVRARLQPMTVDQRQAFAEECNGRATAAVSAIEKAKSYADKITPAMLNGLIVLENETIFQAIKAVRNKDFVISFLNKIPANDRGEFVDAKGEISQDGTRLIATAIFVNVFKGERGLAIATKFFESSDPDMLTVFSSITRSLTGLAQAEALVSSGARQPDYTFSEDLAKVIEVYSTIKQTDGMTVQKYINQQSFDQQLNPFEEKVLQTIAENARSGKRIGQILAAYSQLVIESTPPNQVSFMALEPLTKSQLWDAAVKRAIVMEMSDSAILFDKISDCLRAGAEAMQKTIDEKRDPAVSHQNLTARRARQTANSSADADYMEEVQKAMIGLAAAIDAGTAPEILSKVTNRAQVDQILHRRYDLPEFHKTYLKDLAECVKGAKGAQKIRDVLEILENRVRGEDMYNVPLYGEEEIKVVEESVKICENAGSHLYVAGIMDGITNGKRIIAMGLDSKEKFDQAKEALKQYVSRPAPEVLAKKKERELTASLIGQKIPGFFPTPRPVVDEMIYRAMLEPGMWVLEPSAGKGDIAEAIKEKCPECNLVLVEINPTLTEIMKAKGLAPITQDFMTFTANGYDRILMNPPFEHGQDVNHVKHAYDLLKPGGRLVAIMGEHCFFGCESRCTEFRDWLDTVGESQKLPEGSFTGGGAFRQTGVNSRIVVIDKPGVNKPATAPEQIIESCTYGDTCVAPDGKIGIMHGSGGMGSDRVKSVTTDGNFIGYYDRQELKPANASYLEPERLPIPETPLVTGQQIRLFDKKEITADDVAQLFASKPPPEQMGFDFDAKSYIEPAPFPMATHCPPICPIVPDVPSAKGSIKYEPMPYQKEAYEWLKGKHYALLADEPGVGKTCSAILWAADLRPALVIAPANAVINWAEKEIKGMWRPDDSVILLDGKQDFPKKLPDWVVMSYGMMDKYLDDMKIAGFQSIVVDEAHMVKNMTAKRTQHLLNMVEPDEYEKLRIADLNGDVAKVERLQKRIAKLRPIPNRLAVTGTPVLNRPIELFALLMFLGLKKRKDYKEFVETYTDSEEGSHGTIWKGAKNLDQLYDYMKPFMLRRYKKDVLKDLPLKVNKSMFVPITNAKEYREAETNFLSWLAENKGEEAASRAVDAEVIVQMNTLRQLAAVGKVQPVADWMKPCFMTGSKMLVFSSFTESLQELNRIKEPSSALYTGADSKEQRQKVIEQFQHDPGLCFFLGTVGAAGVAITLTAADRVAFLDLPWTPGGKIQAEDRAHRRGQKKTVEVYNVLAKGTIDERMLELLAQKEQIIAQAVDGKTIDEANAGSIANSLMQSFITAPNLSDSIEEYVPDKPDEDMNEIEDEIIQGVMSDSSYSGEITYPKNTMKGYQLDDSATVTPTSIIPKEWAKYTVSLKLERSPEWSAEKAPIVQSPRDCQRFFTEIRKADREYCMVICVDTHHHLIGLFELSIGDNDSALVNAMEVCRIAAKSGAVDVLMAHYHPSGDPTPSDADREVFKKVRDALALMRVQLLDFFVVGQHRDYGIAFDTRIAVQGTLGDSIDDIVAHLFDHDYTYLAKKLDHCNLSERDQIQIFGWRPLRNFLSWATSRKEPVQVCACRNDLWGLSDYHFRSCRRQRYRY